MPHRFLYASLLVLVVIGLASCCKKRSYCNPDSIKIYFTGFDRSAVRNVTLKKYAKNDTVRHKALDSSLLVYSGNKPLVANRPDTVFFGDYVTTTGGLSAGVYPGYEWVIILPATGNYYTFTTVLDDEHRYDIVKCSDKKSTCNLAISHYSINGAYKDGGTVYLSK